MSYAYIDYKDEDDIQDSYTQKELEIREEFIKMIEGTSTELISEPKDFRQTNPEVLEKVIGPVGSFKEAFIVYLQKLSQIFFTIDPYDIIPVAVDLMDHYMNVYKPDKIPFDPTSGRSSTLYMNMIREEEAVKPFLASEMQEEPCVSPTPPELFLNKIKEYLNKYKLGPGRIYQLDLSVERYLRVGFVGKKPWEEDFDPEEGYDSLTIRFCCGGDGVSGIPAIVDRDYDLNVETFMEFLKELQSKTKASKKRPILLLACRKIKAFSLDVIFYCQQNGILLQAFPAYSKALEPLSRSVIPKFRGRFQKIYKEKAEEEEESFKTSEGIARGMKTVVEEVLAESKELIQRDFRGCLQLGGSSSMETDEFAKESESLYSQEGFKEGAFGEKRDGGGLANLKLKKKKKRDDGDEELNELMFAQIGPLKESDYY